MTNLDQTTSELVGYLNEQEGLCEPISPDELYSSPEHELVIVDAPSVGKQSSHTVYVKPQRTLQHVEAVRPPQTALVSASRLWSSPSEFTGTSSNVPPLLESVNPYDEQNYVSWNIPEEPVALVAAKTAPAKSRVVQAAPRTRESAAVTQRLTPAHDESNCPLCHQNDRERSRRRPVVVRETVPTAIPADVSIATVVNTEAKPASPVDPISLTQPVPAPVALAATASVSSPTTEPTVVPSTVVSSREEIGPVENNSPSVAAPTSPAPVYVPNGVRLVSADEAVTGTISMGNVAEPVLIRAANGLVIEAAPLQPAVGQAAPRVVVASFAPSRVREDGQPVEKSAAQAVRAHGQEPVISGTRIADASKEVVVARAVPSREASRSAQPASSRAGVPGSSPEQVATAAVLADIKEREKNPTAFSPSAAIAAQAAHGQTVTDQRGLGEAVSTLGVPLNDVPTSGDKGFGTGSEGRDTTAEAIFAGDFNGDVVEGEVVEEYYGDLEDFSIPADVIV